ncbi:MAG: hypothetical protein H7Z75_14345 [Ferruginibacter sp.]|nr:hypothetical protein [Cytophagales bacterium]
MKRSTALLVLIAIGFSLSTASAQRRRKVTPTSKYSLASAYYAKRQYVTVGASLNAANYFGDIAPSSSLLSTDLRFTRLNLSVFVMRRLRPRLSVRGAIMWSRLQGDDFNANTSDKNARYRFVRNLHFRNDIKELDATAVVDLYKNKQNFLKRPGLIPYAFAGFGVIVHNPRAKVPVTDGNRWVKLRPLGTEGQGRSGYRKPYSPVQIVIPAGLGIRYRVNRRVDVAFELSFRYTFTDYLDDVSGDYASPEELGGFNSLAYKMAYRVEENIAAYAKESREPGMREFLNEDSNDSPFRPLNGYGQRGDQRGKPSEKDSYIITGFHFNYILVPTGRRSR